MDIVESPKRQRLFDAQVRGTNRLSKLVNELVNTYYAPVCNECKQYNFEVLLEDKPLAGAGESDALLDNEYTGLDIILNKTSVPAAKIGELLHLSAYLITAKKVVGDTGFVEQQQAHNLCTRCVDLEMLQDLVNLLRANLVQSALFLNDMQFDRQLQASLQRASAISVSGQAPRKRAVIDADDSDMDGADDLPVVVPLNKAITVVAILANLCYHFTSRGVDRIYVSNACNSGLLFLRHYAIHALNVFSNNTSHIGSTNNNAHELVRDIEVRMADCFTNIGRMFANAPPGFLTDQVAYSALTTCTHLFKLQPTIFDDYWGNTLLTSAVNVTPLLLPHMHRSTNEVDETDADTGYEEDAQLFSELSSAIIRSPMAVSPSRAALYSVSTECKIHFTTAMFLISCHSVHAPTQSDAAPVPRADEEFGRTNHSRHRRLCDKQTALLKCHDFAYSFLRNLFDKLSLSKTKKGSSDEDVSFEVFQCFCNDLLNCLGEPVFPLVPKMLALLFRIFLAKLEVNRKSAPKVQSGGTNADKHALVLDLLTNLIIRVKTFSCSPVTDAKKAEEEAGESSDLPLSQQFSAAASAEKLDAEIAEFITTNRVHFATAVDEMCSLAAHDRSSEQSVAIDALKAVAARTVDTPILSNSSQVGQVILLELFVTHQMLRKCQTDSSVFELVQVLHSTWHKYELSLDGNDAGEVADGQICARAREQAESSNISSSKSVDKKSFRRSRSRKVGSSEMETDAVDDVEQNQAVIDADDAAETMSSVLVSARYELHNHLLTINSLAGFAKQVKVQWGGGQIFPSTKGADDELLNAAYRLLLLKQNFLNDRIISRIRPLVLWALTTGSALAASKVTRCLSSLIEVDPPMAHDKQLLRTLKWQMLRSTPSVTSACLDCVHNIMLSARTYASLSQNLPIILSRLTDGSKLVRRKAMKMIAQLIGNADLRTILVSEADDKANTAVERPPAVRLCCKTAAWLILAVNGECLTNNESGFGTSTAVNLEAEDVLMRELATTALSQLLMHLLLTTTPTAPSTTSDDYRDIVGQRQVEFFTTLMRVLRDICLSSSFPSGTMSKLSTLTNYSGGGDCSSSTQDAKYTPYAKKIGMALKTVLEHSVPVTADLQSLIHHTTKSNTKSYGFFAGGLLVGGAKKRISENLLVVFRRLAQYTVLEMQEQTRRLLHLQAHEADNNVPIDEQLELVSQFIRQLIEMRPMLFAGPMMVDKFVQILHQLVFSLQYAVLHPQQNLQQQPTQQNLKQSENDWRYRTLLSLTYIVARLARSNVIDAAKPAPAIIAPGNDYNGPDAAVVVGNITSNDADTNSPNSAATLTGLIRKCIRWFLLKHSYVEPFTYDRFVECWIAVAELERRNVSSRQQHSARRYPSQSQENDEDAENFVHGRGYADIRNQFVRLFNMMRAICDNLLTTTTTADGDVAAAHQHQQQQRNVQLKKLLTCLQITAYIWRHLPSLTMLDFPADDSDNEEESGSASGVKQYIVRTLLLCFQFAAIQNNQRTVAASGSSSSALFKRSLLRLTVSNFRALDSTLRCVGLFAVHYPELLQHPVLAGQYLRDVLELNVPPAPPATSAMQRQQYSITAKWLYQLKFRVVRVYLQIMDHAFPAFATTEPTISTVAAVTPAETNEYDDIADVEQRDANSQAVRTERIVTVLMQDRIGQFMQCGSCGSSVLRVECFLLVRKVFRSRLMLPDRYIPFIIALTCDTSPTIVDAAANLLVEVETRYPTFLARAALQGVDHAFRHRCRILTERAVAVRAAAVDVWSASVGVVHGFVRCSEEQAVWTNSEQQQQTAGDADERRSLFSHLVHVIHVASPSPRQAMFAWFRSLVGRFGDTPSSTVAGNAASATTPTRSADESSSHYDLDERLQWQLFIAGSLIYLPYANKDELICLLKAVSDRLHPYGAEHFDNLMSSLLDSGQNASICLQGEQVVKLLDALFTPALLATIKLQLMKMYAVDERELLHDVVAVDENLKKQPVSATFRDNANMSVLKPIARLSYERTKVVTNLALLIPMLRQQKVALQMQYRRHHQASFRIDWKLELNAEQLHVLVEPLKKAVMRAWGDSEEEEIDAGKAVELEPGYADDTDAAKSSHSDDVASVSSVSTPPASRKQPSRKPTSSATSAGKQQHRSRLNAVKNSTPNTTPKRSRRRRKSCESSSDDDDDLIASSSSNEDSNDSITVGRVKSASGKKSGKRRKLEDDDEYFQPGSVTPVKSAVTKAESPSGSEVPSRTASGGKTRPVRQSATKALQRLMNVQKNDDDDD